MLFDLQGKRRRVVQATYLMLALLMGGGLVLFGIGSSGSGGLFDAFSGGGGSSGNEVFQDRIDENEERVEATPRAEGPRKELVRDYYNLAISQTSQDAAGSTFPEEAKDELRRAALHWGAYLEIEKGKPDTSLALVARQIFDVGALNQPQQALRAVSLLAEESGSASDYITMIQYAALANDERTEKLATRKAFDLVPKKQHKELRKQIEELRGQAIAQQVQAEGATAPGGGGSSPQQ